MRIQRIVAAGIALLVAVACGDGGTNPSAPKTAIVTLVTPNGDDGAVIVTLRGPELSDIQPAAGYLAYSRSSGAQETRLIVVGNFTAGALVTVSLGSGHPLAEYSGSVEQVATRSGALRTSTAQYALTFATATATP